MMIRLSCMAIILSIVFVSTIFAQTQSVQESNTQQTTSESTKVYKIGDKGPAGGLIFYDKGSYSDGWRFLEAAPVKSEFSAPWGLEGIDVKGTDTGIGSGKNNTLLIVKAAVELKQSGTAAQRCVDLNIGGQKDWFLPSRDEAMAMSQNLTGVKGAAFTNRRYWSSSQDVNDFVVSLMLDRGTYGSFIKTPSYLVRAVRAF